MVQVDLHLHTTYSDGMLSPAELVRLCAGRGLRVIAITDHDSTEGVPEALQATDDIQDLAVISGIELSADEPGSEVHLLGYFVEHQDPELQRTLRGLREGRDQRAKEIVRKLDGMGVHISWRRVQELSDGGAIGRPHIAKAMVEGGYVQYPRDAFDKYLGRGGLAHVEREKCTTVMAVDMLVRNGALPAMAHPIYSMASTDPSEVVKLKRMLSELKEAGLVGLEVYYAEHSPEQVQLFAAVADEVGLVPCGGSDYHASGNPGEHDPGSAGPPMESVETLRSLKERRVSTS